MDKIKLICNSITQKNGFYTYQKDISVFFKLIKNNKKEMLINNDLLINEKTLFLSSYRDRENVDKIYKNIISEGYFFDSSHAYCYYIKQLNLICAIEGSFHRLCALNKYLNNHNEINIIFNGNYLIEKELDTAKINSINININEKKVYFDNNEFYQINNIEFLEFFIKLKKIITNQGRKTGVEL